MFSSQGKDVAFDEYEPLATMFSSLSKELPYVMEYKNDLVPPNLPCVSDVSFAQTTTFAIHNVTPDPTAEVTEQQWANVSKMVAWFFVHL